MSAKHRRMPSALPLIGCSAFEEEPAISFNSTITFDPPSIQTIEPQDKKKLKSISKTTTNAGRLEGQKFFHNYSISSNNEHCSFLSSSTENLVKEMTQMNKLNEIHEIANKKDKIPEPKISELGKGMTLIIKSREIFQNKLESLRKDIKRELLYVFSRTGQLIQTNSSLKSLVYTKIETSDIDTERRVDSVRCSGDTVEGPGSAYHIDDLSLVKFDTSAENYEKKPKKVKFKGLS